MKPIVAPTLTSTYSIQENAPSMKAGGEICVELLRNKIKDSRRSSLQAIKVLIPELTTDPSRRDGGQPSRR